ILRVGFGEERRIERQAQVGAGAFHVLGDAVSGAHDELAIETFRRPCNANARLKAFIVRIIKRAAVAVFAGKELTPAEQLEIRLTIRDFDHRRGVFPAHAQVERKIVVDLIVVLEKHANAVLAVSPFALVRAADAADPFAREQVEQEVGEGDARELCAVGVCAEYAVVARVVAILLITLQLAAHLERMAPAQPRQVVAVVERVWHVVFVGPDRANITEATAELDSAEAGNNLSAGDAQLLVGVADARPIERVVGDEYRPVEPDASLIDQSRADRARPVDGDVLRTAKLRVPGRDQRNRTFVVDLLVIGERVTAGDVVLLTQARVKLYVELVAVNLAPRHDRENGGLIGRVDVI